MKIQTPSVFRVMDANLNRAREGLRVLEDGCRFVLNDKRLFRRFRSLRHALDRESRPLYPKLVEARNSNGDMGRMEIPAPQAATASVMSANMRRAQEALRVLEEFARLLPGRSSQKLGAMRFELYSAEKRLMASLRRINS